MKKIIQDCSTDLQERNLTHRHSRCDFFSAEGAMLNAHHLRFVRNSQRD